MKLSNIGIFHNNIVQSIVVVVIIYVLYKIIDRFIFKNKTATKFFVGNRSMTFINLLRNATKYIFLFLGVLIILQINGVNVTSLMAGVGIISIVVGLALQDALKDIIKGFNILSDSYFKVGDVIKYKQLEGKVLVIGLKTTKIKDITNQNIISIANRNIEQVEVVSTQLDIELPLSYELKQQEVRKVLDAIVVRILNQKAVSKCEYLGINEFSDSSIKYLIRIQCNPATKYQTKRDSQVIIIEELEHNNIEIPYNQIDVHTK